MLTRLIIFFFTLLFVLTGCSSATDKTAALATPNSDSPMPFTVQVLGINDFHGQVLPNNTRGGMYNLAAHLIKAIESTEDHTFIVHAGDHVGASPAESALSQDEPSISFLNYVAEYCKTGRDASCHVLGTAGNHEFDEGTPEMLRLLNGGNHVKGPFLDAQWHGATYPTLSANVFDRNTGKLILPPYIIHEVNGVPIGFIGLTLDYTPDLVVPGMVDDLRFVDQALVAKRYVDLLQQQGIESIVIVVHDGAGDKYYSGSTQNTARIDKHSPFGQFLAQLPNAVDLVVTGHSHRFTNAYFTRKGVPDLLVTQAFSSGRAYADITLTINPTSQDVTQARATVHFANDAPTDSVSTTGKQTLAHIETLIANAVDYAKTYTDAIIGTYQPTADEPPLGQFIANSHHAILQTDMAIMNSGGVRASLQPGPITWGDLFAVQPFNNQLVVRQFTGAQLQTLINERHYWSSNVVLENEGNILWQGQTLNADQTYTVGGNAYIMNSKAFAVGKLLRVGELDIDATRAYIQSLGPVFSYNSLP